MVEEREHGSGDTSVRGRYRGRRGQKGKPEKSCVVRVRWRVTDINHPSTVNSTHWRRPWHPCFSFPSSSVISGNTSLGDKGVGSVYDNNVQCLHSGRSIHRVKVEILQVLSFLVYVTIITAGETDYNT